MIIRNYQRTFRAEIAGDQRPNACSPPLFSLKSIMNSQWKVIKFGVLLFALPLVATAAASAHQWMAISSPISTGVASLTASESSISMERVHTIALNGNGAIEGRIASIESGSDNAKGISKLKIYFVQNRNVVKETFTNSDGTFVVNDLPEGDYSFVAAGQGGFAAYGVRVVSDITGKYDNVMEIAAVSQSVGSVRKIIMDGVASSGDIVNRETRDAAPEDFEGANRVKLVDGNLQGRVFPINGHADLVDQTMIHILQSKRKVAEVEADRTGAFEVPDLEPGVYEFVAFGPCGMAVVAFEAVETVNVSAVGLVDAASNPLSIELEPEEEAGFSPAAPDYAALFNVLLIEPQDVPTPVSSSVLEDNGVAPIEFAGEGGSLGGASGGSAGSAGNFSQFSSTPMGGGGGAAGFGGGGRLLTLGLVGGIVAVAVTSGNPSDASNPNP